MEEIIIDKIECKYKFQDKEKFNGKPYCTLFNELCQDVSFVCDKNCQVFENYKQLKRKEKELQRYKDMEAKGLEEIKDVGGCWGCGIQAQVNQDMVDLKKYKDEIEDLKTKLWLAKVDVEDGCLIIGELKAENEELKNKIDSLQVDKWAEEDAPTIKEEKYYNALQEIKNLNLFSLNNSQEKITRINKIISEVEE